ncbi:NAD(P)H-dependent oxidoreductase [Sorangium sp. So ce119]|uniref:NAD(P)H-dependent oxidoreductase n=1 Tax=Sorangium sp. So ce119 TaxID=3133279 RepID=UPI003F5F2085
MHLIIQGHPAPDSLSDSLARAYAIGLERGGARVEHLALRSLSFDPHLRAGFSGRQELEPDLLQARTAIERSTHVAWFFPTWWAGPPALIKGFIDRTFLPGWSFAYRKRSPLPDGLLAGRSARVVTTMDSPSWWYRFWHRRSVHASFVNATLRFVGFGPVRETTYFNQNTRTPVQRETWLREMERIGERDARRFRAGSG